MLSAARCFALLAMPTGKFFKKGVVSMSRNFFSKVLSAGLYTTRRYLYMVEYNLNMHTKSIVRYPRRADGSVWFVDNPYVCAVYSMLSA